MADSTNIEQHLVQISRLAMSGRVSDVQAYLRKAGRQLRRDYPPLADQLLGLAASGVPAAPLRDASATFTPVDGETQLSLLKFEAATGTIVKPLLNDALMAKLEQVVLERRSPEDLEKIGLLPTRSLLMVGPPGVGKTHSARWLAGQLNRPLLTLDLATVMSSFLGKTGSNVRLVLDYAKSVSCVLFLDEFDAIAKKRGDDSDVGELKRLVTVILQEIDDWPSDNVLIAATNHGELLDPAVWRRFDDVLYFDAPSPNLARDCLRAAFVDDEVEAEPWIEVMATVWSGRSFSDLKRSANWARRRAAVTGVSLAEAIAEAIREDLRNGPLPARKQAAALLDGLGLPERKISFLTGVARDTLRKHIRQNNTVG